MRVDTLPPWPVGKPAATAQSSEENRAKVIASFGLNRIADDCELEGIVQFAAALCGVPTSLVSIVERERQWFAARTGLELRETPRPTSFCAHAMLGDGIFEIRDASKDARFADNALVTGEPHIRFYAGAPLVSSEGAPIGALCVIDYTPRPEGLTALQRQGLVVLSRAVMQRMTCERINQNASDALDEADQRLLQLAEHLPVFAWSADAEGTIDFANSAFFEYLGTRDTDKINFAALTHPDDLEQLMTVRTDARARGEKWEARMRIRGADGSYRWMMARAWPVRDRASGAIVNWFGAAVDIDDIHRLAESRDVLARELSHRIKNIFAVVSGLVSLRSRGREDLRQFASELNEVFHALGRAHDYVRPLEGRKGDSLHELLRDLLAPYRAADGAGIAIRGDDAVIGARAATPLALVFHELATNAAKYGALSVSGGSIAITLTREDDQVVVDWQETIEGGAQAGTRDGFGTRLLKMAVESQLGGSFERRFSERGLEVVLRFPQHVIQS